MSDGQTHGERLEWKVGALFTHKAYPNIPHPHVIEGKDGDMFVVRWSDSGGVGRLSAETLNRWCSPATPQPDPVDMLREAYALAKAAGDYNAMARIADMIANAPVRL